MCFAGNAAAWGVVFAGRLSPGALGWFPRCVGATLAGKWPLLLLLGVVKSGSSQTVPLFPATFGLIGSWHQAKQGGVTECLLSACSVHFRRFLVVMAAATC